MPRLFRLLPAARGRRAPWAARAGPEQAAGTLKDDHIALGLGTRAPRHLTTTVGGEPVELKPGKGRLSRSSYRMDVTYAGRFYRRQPDSIPGSRFTRDRARPGDFSSDGDGLVIAEWREGTGAEPADAAVAYAPAAAFGTGAQPLWTTAVDAVAAAVP
ncbi:hypothetical protein [Streptomyces peucetius]|uniref:Uncharacterized protein n=1 Tax=Streptomyces peucetius TaxID=1950 RepID=A0ABY6IBU4_STRPE|nr:hypothetical protein [Streptomyces peucetius]UYQ63439.1 hypothetical protein OGH68_19550 [Streptomyces peucetius]